MKKLLGILVSLCLAATVSVAAHAQEHGSKDEAVAMVKAVQAMNAEKGLEATAEAVTTQTFNDRDLYPFIFTLEGVNVAHGAKKELVGKNLHSAKDVEGVYFIQEMIKISAPGTSGWVDFKWPNPVSKKIEQKSAYVEKLGDGHFVGVGAYK